MKIYFDINYSNKSFCAARNLKPLSEHNGPLLKLTKKEQKEIDGLQALVKSYKDQIYAIERYLNKKSLTAELRSYYKDRINDLNYSANILVEKIKVNRYNIQKQEMK